MASVAICPHCYLQLVVPDGVEPGERVECPTCAKEFGLDQAVLRPIPEVVRRSQATPEATLAAASNAIEDIDEILIEERLVDVSPAGERESDEAAAHDIEEIKARIEAGIAAGGLLPGTNTSLSLDEPILSLEPADASGSIPSAKEEEDPLAAFRNARTVAQFPDFGNELERQEEISIDIEVDEIVDEVDESVPPGEESGKAEDDLALEPDESRAAQPTVRTLADWMQPREESPEQAHLPEPLSADADAEIEEAAKDAEAALGPSFDLPNVPLVPKNGATIEFDPNMSFGPAAETEFELDDVNFESASADGSAEDPYHEEEAEESEPVFSEPRNESPSAPFVLPGVPRPPKKRSIVRVLVGVALGAFVGLSLGYFILLNVLGPEGDLLQIAKFIPSAVLPKSFQTSTPVAAASAPPAAAPDAPAAVEVASGETSATEESANVPAGYVEEARAGSGTIATGESADDDRFGSEPALLDEPAAEPIAEESPAVTIPALPLRGPTFTVDELARALEAGEAAQRGLVEGDLSDSSVRKTKGASYEKLGELAEVLTFFNRSSPSIESEDATSGAQQLFAEILSNPHTQQEIARIVSIWVPSPHRSNSGIFFAGVTSGGQIAGDIYEYEVATEEGSKFTLLAAEPLEPTVEGSHRPIGIVGAIVDNPVENVAGYAGSAERAIWLTQAIPLD